jgi:hypothetical protein
MFSREWDFIKDYLVIEMIIMPKKCPRCGKEEFRRFYKVKHELKEVCLVCEGTENEDQKRWLKLLEGEYKQTKLFNEEHDGFKIGDIVRFKDKNPDYDLVIVKFYTPDFVSLARAGDEKEGKDFSASANIVSLEKV